MPPNTKLLTANTRHSLRIMNSCLIRVLIDKRIKEKQITTMKNAKLIYNLRLE